MKTSRIRTASFALLVIVAGTGTAAYVWRGSPPLTLSAAFEGAPAPQTTPDGSADTQSRHGHDRTGGHQGAGGSQGGPVAVTTAIARAGVLPLDIPATGFAVADQTTMLTAAVQGIVTAIHATDGQTVKAGDLIATLDDRTARAAVAKDDAMILRDGATLAEAETALRRAQDLLATNAGSQQTVDQAKAARDTAAATVEADKATRAADAVLLEHTEIRAPFDGRLGEIEVSLGANLAFGAPVARLVKFDPVYVDVHLEQALLPRLRAALAKGPVAVTTVPDEKSETPVEGTLSFFDNSVDPASATILVKARFDNPDGRLWPGQAVNLIVHVKTDEERIIVPTVAVSPGQQGSVAYVVRDGKASLANVTVDRVAGDLTAVSVGLAAGDHVVVEGQAQLFDGRAVKETPAAPASGSTAAEQTP
ncbi:RND family efflux transporter, MFP subunit [Rhizobium sp. RU20A]|uniref:efflux RND transporter periplasmic adaptor subunit n=1 Tax=Rhizobium sp. RU20A TaxID=1907412 RepID=UPI0009561D88|nr:efflux RND transporter periplasmic adaptor subunit [Rhizobium sp. RU20A]SIQ13118.1 RND family efflux transporter, MFP subunit [Rhizobium sp. RU20A]